MAIPVDGESLGAVTAGCLEGPVADIGREVVESDAPTVETFDLTDDGDDAWGLGLGCNGVIDVLVEPLDGSLRAPLDHLDDVRPVAVLTAVCETESVPVGARATLTVDDEEDENDAAGGDRAWSPPAGTGAADARPALPADVVASLRERALEFAAAGKSQTVRVETEDGDLSVFVDGLEPVAELLLFGNQNDVHPVARLGREAGFRVTVASARGGRADADAFPHADRVVATHPTDIDEVLEDPERTYAVLMSHNFLDDRLALQTLLETDVPYVGLMGPRKRFEQLRDDLNDDGVALSEADLARIATPVGLDLGGGEPGQIALSVVAEAVAVSNGRDGGRLADRKGPIHPRDESA
ncbi:XdhC family protein (plasmid) [Halorussus vallis]|nr:XdhC/CoxI family protein [Halorussus vallis]USZ78346.1 XdhC family protein [Halorussus vallis]